MRDHGWCCVAFAVYGVCIHHTTLRMVLSRKLYIADLKTLPMPAHVTVCADHQRINGICEAEEFLGRSTLSNLSGTLLSK